MSDAMDPRVLSSFGGLQHFKKAKKPKEAGQAKYCVDCAYEPSCAYSAKKVCRSGHPSNITSCLITILLDRSISILSLMEL